MTPPLGIAALLLCGGEILTCFRLRIASHRRGGAMAISAGLSGITGLMLLLHRVSPMIGGVLLALFQVLFVASLLAFRRHLTQPSH